MKEISKRARQYVKEERDKYGFDLAWHYFANNINWNEPLNEWDSACKKAFDYWHKKELKLNESFMDLLYLLGETEMMDDVAQTLGVRDYTPKDEEKSRTTKEQEK